jgi:uncharacterized membrane protein
MYLVFKVLHITAVIAFLGNIAAGLFWYEHAARSRDPRLLAHALDGVIRSDRLFTIPAVVIIILTGVGLAIHGHLSLLRTSWIFWSLVLFSISGILFAARVAPLQLRLRALAAAGADSGVFEYERFAALARRWQAWGAAALAAPLAALVLMVVKPAL